MSPVHAELRLLALRRQELFATVAREQRAAIMRPSRPGPRRGKVTMHVATGALTATVVLLTLGHFALSVF